MTSYEFPSRVHLRQVRRAFDAPNSWTACAACSRDGALAELADVLGDLYGGRVAVARVAAIPAEVSGKHRLARCAANASATQFEGPMRAP